MKNRTHPNNTRPGRTAQLNGPLGTFRYTQTYKKKYCYRIKLQDQGVSSTERNASEHFDNRYLQ